MTLPAFPVLTSTFHRDEDDSYLQRGAFPSPFPSPIYSSRVAPSQCSSEPALSLSAIALAGRGSFTVTFSGVGVGVAIATVAPRAGTDREGPELLRGKRQHLNRVRSNQTACAESCVQLPSLIASCDPYKPIDKLLSFRPSHLRFHFLPSRKRMLTVFSFFASILF